jgi:hypothetical protein
MPSLDQSSFEPSIRTPMKSRRYRNITRCTLGKSLHRSRGAVFSGIVRRQRRARIPHAGTRLFRPESFACRPRPSIAGRRDPILRCRGSNPAAPGGAVGDRSRSGAEQRTTSTAPDIFQGSPMLTSGFRDQPAPKTTLTDPSRTELSLARCA